jgi:ectoine hydroxylase-related dioxygenase (phytanoyl-CoA dioxygenase family)
MSVTKQNLEFYEDNGYFIQENVFSSDECDALINASTELDNARNSTYRPSMMPHRVDQIYLKAMASPKLANIMDNLVGGLAAGIQTEFFYCKPGTRGFSLHQDNFFVEAPLGQFASAWCALTDVTPENGALIVYPGSHKEGLLPVRKLELGEHASQDPNANNEECVVPNKYKPITPSVAKGSVLFIHGHVVHGSNPNSSNRWRQVLLCTYIKSGAPFRAGRYAKRSEVKLADV